MQAIQVPFAVVGGIALILPAASAAPQQSEDLHVVVMANQAPIYVGPSPTSARIATASKGDVFELRGEVGNWFTIAMFSGEWRYISEELVTDTAFTLILPNLESERRAVFRALVQAEDKAQIEADARYPIRDRASLDRNVDYQWLLDDRYKLDVMHRFGVQPPAYGQLVVEGLRKGWVD